RAAAGPSLSTCMSVFTAKPPGTMRENRRLCLSAPNNAARAEAASLGPSNRRATRGTRFVPETRQGGDTPVPGCNHYTHASSHLDPSQSSMFRWKNRKAAAISKSFGAATQLSFAEHMARYEIPERLPEFVECGDAFVPANEATLEEWQRHKNLD